MKKLISILLLAIIFIAGCSNKSVIKDRNIVYSSGSDIHLDSVFGDYNATRLANTSDIIVVGTVTEELDPYYISTGFPYCNYEIKIDEVIKGDINLGDTITVLSHCGYIPFDKYISVPDNELEMNYVFGEATCDLYSNDSTAVVEVMVQESVIMEKGNQYVLLLQSYDSDKSIASWSMWTDRSSVIRIVNGHLEGYATSLFGNTLSELKSVVEEASLTPDKIYSVNQLEDIWEENRMYFQNNPNAD